MSDLPEHEQNLRQLWRDLAEEGIDLGVDWPHIVRTLFRDIDRLRAAEAAIDRVRRRHPRGDEESGLLAPGLWCPTCGRERTQNGYGGCPDRNALTQPPARADHDTRNPATDEET